jgi:hypothetical protein
MHALLLSTWSLPAAQALAEAARKAGWQAHTLDETPAPDLGAGEVVFYGGTDVARAVADTFGLALLEPPLDLLARLPLAWRQRAVEFCRFRDLHRLQAPTFVKPADPWNKSFDAGSYADVRDIRAPHGIDPETPVLVAEPVEWLAEYRCFVLDGKVTASSPYLSFGRPVWRPHGQGGERAQESGSVLSFCARLLAESAVPLPPAFVVDVGLIEGRGWAVVEFNPAWCSGLLGADPVRVLDVLRRACRDRGALTDADRRWVVERTRP